MDDDLALRILYSPHRNWGSLLPDIGYGRCYRCRRPWWAVRRVHDVWIKSTHGQFALCQSCWGRSTVEERWQAHAWVCSLSEAGWSVDKARSLRRAIFEGQP